MAQKYFLDSGLLIEAERSAAQYQADPDWDPAIHGIADTGQTWDPLDVPPDGPATGRSPSRESWLYFPTLNLFCVTNHERHAIENAMVETFGVQRAEEIRDLVERYGPWRETLDRLNIAKAKRKVQAAVSAGLITAGEAQQLRDLVAHILLI